MVCPEAPSYKPRMLRRFWQSLGVPSQKSKLSSAKRKCETYTPPRHEAMACSWPDTVACHNNEDNPSTQRRKRYRERGSPCLIPRVWMICPLGSPLFSTEYEAVRTVSIANSTHWSDNPILSIICWRKSHSTRSYALLISNLTAIWPIFPFLLFRIRWSISYATIVLSVISLSGTKVLWELGMTFGRMVFTLLASTFDTN